MNAKKPIESVINDLLAHWYECAPYGEQIPDGLPQLFSEFAAAHHGKDESAMCDAFSTADPSDPIMRLFECIFTEGARHAIGRLADAVYDRNRELLEHIDLVPHGTLATTENDPNPTCEHQHIMHPDQGGRMLFAEALPDENSK